MFPTSCPAFKPGRRSPITSTCRPRSTAVCLLAEFTRLSIDRQCVLTGSVEERVSDDLVAWRLLLADRQKFSVIALGFPAGALYGLTRHLPTPGTVILLDANPEVYALRAGPDKPLRGLRSSVSIQTGLSDAFATLARRHAEIRVVDADRPLDEVFEAVRAIVDETMA